MAKSAVSLHSGPHPQHTRVLKLHSTPRRKVTALADTLVRHDTLTEKRVAKILKCFTFSSGPLYKRSTLLVSCFQNGDLIIINTLYLSVVSSKLKQEYFNLSLNSEDRNCISLGYVHPTAVTF